MGRTMTRSRYAATNHCIICEKNKPTKDFSISHLGYVNSYCKVCASDRTKTLRYSTYKAYIGEIIKKKRIKKQHEKAAILLLYSARSRFEACLYNLAGYEDIECNYDSEFIFFEVLLFEVEDFWEEWIRLYKKYVKSNYQKNKRPNVDRMDAEAHYTKDNVQALSNVKNISKATSKPCKAIVLKKGICVGGFAFNSRTEFNEELSKHCPSKVIASLKLDTLEFQQIDTDTYILLQSNSFDLDKVTDSISINDAKYELTINMMRHYVDAETHKEVKREHLYTIKSPVGRVIIK